MKKSDNAAGEQVTKSPPWMIMASASTSGIARWDWRQGLEYRNGLMRPEITQYLVKITAELADILGIRLEEVGQG